MSTTPPTSTKPPVSPLQWMLDALRFEREEYTDSGGCARYTHLAESCAAELALYEDNGFDIPEQVFEVALEAVDRSGGFNT